MRDNTIKKANIALHKEESKYYDKIHGELFNWYKQLLIKRDIKKMLRLKGHFENILDIGCGTGNLLLHFLDKKVHITGVDISEKMLEELKNKLANLNYKANIKLECTDIDKFLEKTVQKYDLILCCSFLHHLPDYIKVIKRSIKILKHGGLLYITHEPIDVKYRKVNFISRVLKKIDRELYKIILTRIQKVIPPRLDYSLADFHSKDGCNMNELKGLLMKLGYEIKIIKVYSGDYKLGAISYIDNLFSLSKDKFTIIAQFKEGV